MTTHGPPDVSAWNARFFQPPLFDSESGLTTDPAKVSISRKEHTLLPTISPVGPADDDLVPAKGLILGPMHVPKLLNDPELGPPALEHVSELASGIRQALTQAYGADAPLRHLIWAGMGGPVEDKYAALASGLAPSDGVRVWGLDDINGDTLSYIYQGIAEEEQGDDSESRLRAGLQKTVVVAQALGMASVEPVFNVKHSLAPTFTKLGLEVSTHFYKVTIPGSLLDQALQPPVSNIVHQPHGQSTCAGRHDYVSHGMLLPRSSVGLTPRDMQQGSISAATISRTRLESLSGSSRLSNLARTR